MAQALNAINQLPPINALKRLAQGLALLEAAVMPEWQYRYFSCNGDWDGAGQELMASMRDGSGSEYFLHFTAEGVAGKVVEPGAVSDTVPLLQQVPERFASFKNEPAFSNDRARFFFWRGVDEPSWSAAPADLATYAWLGFFVDTAALYQQLAADDYEVDLPKDVIEAVLHSLTISAEQLALLNPELSLEDLDDDVREIMGPAH